MQASKVCVTHEVRKWCTKSSPLPSNYCTLIISKDMPGDRCAIQGPQCVENGGEEGTPYCGALCEAL